MDEPDRRRLDEVFGEVLPQTSADENAEEERMPVTADETLLADRPPHHDRD